MLTVLLGGARSGKSSLAIRLAATHGSDVTYIATCPQIDGDDDLDARIAIHRAERPTGWTTIEEPTDLPGALDRAGEAFAIVDCLTLWTNNLMFGGSDEAAVLAACDDALEVIGHRTAPTVAISNEVGLGIVPADAGTRDYRDVLGRVNQRWVAASDRAWLLVAGRAVRLDDPMGLT